MLWLPSGYSVVIWIPLWCGGTRWVLSLFLEDDSVWFLILIIFGRDVFLRSSWTVFIKAGVFTIWHFNVTFVRRKNICLMFLTCMWNVFWNLKYSTSLRSIPVWYDIGLIFHTLGMHLRAFAICLKRFNVDGLSRILLQTYNIFSIRATGSCSEA